MCIVEKVKNFVKEKSKELVKDKYGALMSLLK